jgi:glycosyltransferase 2 family protein
MDGEPALHPDTAVARPGEVARPSPGTRHRGAERLRALILGPRGGGTTRRRASDAVRLGTAIVLVAVSVPLIRANTAVEIQLTRLLTPPPDGLRWLVTTLWQLGSVGVIVALALGGLLVPRLAAVRQMAIAGLGTLGVCLALSALLGPSGGRPPIPQLSGIDTHYPVTQLAVAMAVALTGLPFLSRPMHRIAGAGLALAAFAALVGGYGLPINVAASIAIGWGMAAACHLAFGSPLGLPSAAEVTTAVRDLRVDVRELAPAAKQEWGVEAFAGQDSAGHRLELAVYGRDAADAQWLTKLWRFLLYRDSGPTLMIHRSQQVEHEAYLTLLAANAGVRVPEVVAAGRCGPSDDAVLVTRVPAGPRLAAVPADQVPGQAVADFLRSVLALRAAGIAHGGLSPEAVVLAPGRPCLRDFRRASTAAPVSRTDRDLAAALGAAAVVVGADRAVAAAHQVLDAGTVQAVLTQLQRSTLDPVTVRMARSHKDFVKSLRESLAGAFGMDVPKLVEPKRISWPNLLMVVGSLIGLWAILGVLSDASGSLSVMRGASWSWVAVAFVLAQLPILTDAWTVIGSVPGPMPYGRCVALETSNMFTSLVGGQAAVFGVRVRFFQRQGFDAAAAISAGAIASTASWIVKGLLFLISIPLAAGNFHVPTSGGERQAVVWIVIAVILAAAVVGAVVTLVPRVRRLARERLRPHLVSIWANLKTIAAEPRKIVYVAAGSTLSQLFIALCLGATLNAVGEHLNLPTIIVVQTLASIIGGAAPVPGGAGVIEAGTIAGLTAAGVPQSQAVAAVFIERLWTAYLPPIWGWLTLVWMRRREYI